MLEPRLSRRELVIEYPGGDEDYVLGYIEGSGGVEKGSIVFDRSPATVGERLRRWLDRQEPKR